MTTPASTPPPLDARSAPPPDDVDGGPCLFVEDARFAMVPEWVIDLALPDAAFRLYVLLLRYGASTGVRMPSRTTLARRLRRSTDAVDRAMRALVQAGVVIVEHRRRDGVFLSNRYHVRTSAPRREQPVTPSAPADAPAPEGGRTSAATPERTAVAAAEPAADASAALAGGGRTSAATPSTSDTTPPAGPAARSGGGRTSAATGRACTARVAADVRPYREVPTERTPPPPPSPAPSPAPRRAGPSREETELLREMHLDAAGVADLAARCAAARAAHGLGTACWQPTHLLSALTHAVRSRGWPAHLAAAALTRVAADPTTRSPMRVAEAGPWWDEAATSRADTGHDGVDVEALEQRLLDLDGDRLRLQAAARAELDRDGLPLTRATVLRRACEILDRGQAAS